MPSSWLNDWQASTRTDADVWDAVTTTAAANGFPTGGAPAVDPTTDCTGAAPPEGTIGMCAYYTDIDGNVIVDGAGDAFVVGAGAGIPGTASGVEASSRP